MSLNAVKRYVAQQATGISLEGTVWRRLNAYRQIPKSDPDGFRCLATVGDVRRHSERLTAPRGLGQKERVYSVDLLLQATHDDAERGGDAFDQLVENAEENFATATPGAFALTDAVTGRTSQITHVGETVDVHTLAPEWPPLKAPLTFRAVLTLEVHEIITA